MRLIVVTRNIVIILAFTMNELAVIAGVKPSVPSAAVPPKLK